MVVLVCALFDIWVWEKYVWRIRKKGNKVPVNTYINITIRKYLSILCFKFNPAFAFGINISARLSILEFEFQTVKFQHVSSSNFAQVFWFLARVIQVFQVFLRSSIAEFEFWGLKLIEYSGFNENSSFVDLQFAPFKNVQIFCDKVMNMSSRTFKQWGGECCRRFFSSCCTTFQMHFIF